ncbi:MAG TPA: protein kinase [Terriglobia bacterium]|nr:protein kinase [Terriglobia bacterium]
MDERWQEIERIYHAACEIDKNARAEFLTKACAGDESLRREVEFLLAQDEQAGDFLESPAIEVVAESLAKDEHLSGPAKPSVEIGAMIAHYRLAAKIGEGGMGEVYRARDTKLQRDVAIKILPHAMASDADRMARFEREAKVLASLNHPNIAAIYGLEESNGIRALVMELVEGETLAERIVGEGSALPREPKGLPYTDALSMAKQITEALEYAHERGVIHRDLKPANVKITPEGAVKVLDFGLAKVLGGTSASPVHGQDAHATDQNSPTLATQPGMILGTAAYMSPEQARGQPVDRRCDIWAFGCVLYEMLSRRKAFDGETISDVLAAVLTKEPDLATLPPTTPSGIQRLLRRCLVKDAKQRLRDIGEARIAIEETLAGDVGERSALPREGEALPYVPPQVSPLRRALPWLATTLRRPGTNGFFGGLAAGILIALIVAYWQMPILPPPRVSGYLQLTHNGLPKELVGTDGSRLYLVETASGRLRNIAQVSVAGGEVGLIRVPSPVLHALNVSPDGSDLLFVNSPSDSTEGALWAVPILGGSPRRLTDAIGYEGAWSADKKSLVYFRSTDLYVANGDGTKARKIVTLPGALSADPQTGTRYVSGAWSPDGRQIRFTIIDAKTQSESIWQVSADGTNLHQLLPGWHPSAGECCGKWMPDGKYFVFQSQGQLWARRESGSFLRKTGHEPVQITSGAVEYSTPLPSKDGRRLFAVAGFSRAELERYDTKSQKFLPFLSGISAGGVSFSRDHQRVAYVSYPEGNLWLSKADGRQRLQLTFPPMSVAAPRWSPDGKQIAFAGELPNTPMQIYVMSADGGSPGQVTDGSRDYVDPTWSPDGASLVLGIAVWAIESGVGGIYELNLKTRKETKLPGSDGLWSPRRSPDGRYVTALTLDDKKMLLFDYKTRNWTELSSLAQQGWQEWSHDGQYIFFWGTNGQSEPGIYRMRVSDRKIEKVVSLKDFQEAPGLLGGWIGLAPDGSPLLVKDTGTQDVVAMDWVAP